MARPGLLAIPPDVTVPVVLLRDRKPRFRAVDRSKVAHRIATGTLVKITDRLFKTRVGSSFSLQRLPLFRERHVKQIPPQRGLAGKMSPRMPRGSGDHRLSPYFRLLDDLAEGRQERRERAHAIVEGWHR